ncbi:MAG: DUF6273 domain-containing protein [Ruminococcus sp.]|nr:DUF6273 domain-containing protein [Ruminococcus sp.]
MSIFESSSYKSALAYADPVAKTVYQAEAKAIDDIQKGILEIANKEDPFDIFICYKETDESGRRTPDSVLAQDLYDELTERGYKVFFSRITLEDKLGQEYEPYIFAALSSARVMLAIGTKSEYYDAVWVKNEWSRYLSLMQEDRKKTLIPCYRDMDAYDMPAEFKNLQGQDMGRLGFVQDLVRGIDKLIGKTETPQATVQPAVNPVQSEVENLLKRGQMALEDAAWSDASNFFEEVLNKNAEEPRAYRGKLLAEMECDSIDALETKYQAVLKNSNYQKAIRYGDTELEDKVILFSKQEEMLKKELQELETEQKKYNAEIQKIQQQINSLQPSVPESAEYRTLHNQVTETTQKLTQATKEYENHRRTIAELEGKLRLFGLFHKKEKQATQQQIEVLRGQLNAASDKKEALEQEKKDLEKKMRPLAEEYQASCEKEKAVYAEPFLKSQKELREKAENVQKRIETVKGKLPKILFAKKSDIIKFGKYEWIVLKKEANKAMLITKDEIEKKKYHEVDESVTWETCTLRKWLNEDFYSTFAPEEQARILETHLENSGNKKHGTKGGNDTDDKIFLLSLDEAEKYMTEDERKANSWWWLRSPGYYQAHAAGVLSGGGFDAHGDFVIGEGGVRPALNLKF